MTHTHELLHGQEERVHADAGYTGVDKRAEITKAQAQGGIRKDVKCLVATKRGVITAMPEGPRKALTVPVERKKAQIRALVEHRLHVIKNLFRYKKVSYRGLTKNGARLNAQSGPEIIALRLESGLKVTNALAFAAQRNPEVAGNRWLLDKTLFSTSLTALAPAMPLLSP